MMYSNQEMLRMDSRHSPINLPLDAIGALTLGQRVDAIQIVRKELGLDINAAKALIEAYERQNPALQSTTTPITHTNAGWLWLLLGLLLLAALAVAWLP